MQGTVGSSSRTTVWVKDYNAIYNRQIAAAKGVALGMLQPVHYACVTSKPGNDRRSNCQVHLQWAFTQSSPFKVGTYNNRINFHLALVPGDKECSLVWRAGVSLRVTVSPVWCLQGSMVAQLLWSQPASISAGIVCACWTLGCSSLISLPLSGLPESCWWLCVYSLIDQVASSVQAGPQLKYQDLYLTWYNYLTSNAIPCLISQLQNLYRLCQESGPPLTFSPETPLPLCLSPPSMTLVNCVWSCGSHMGVARPLS